jgi:hypothetical protein
MEVNCIDPSPSARIPWYQVEGRSEEAELGDDFPDESGDDGADVKPDL